MADQSTGVRFAPQLIIPSGVKNIDFYLEAFGATERMRWSNEDGSIHVAELAIGDLLFHLHEAVPSKRQLDPVQLNGITTIIGLFVPDVDAVMKKAVAAGATEVNPAQDYEYGYRQGEIKDPFGHLWLIQKKI
jgi:PhnB protein